MIKVRADEQREARGAELLLRRHHAKEFARLSVFKPRMRVDTRAPRTGITIGDSTNYEIGMHHFMGHAHLSGDFSIGLNSLSVRDIELAQLCE